MNSYKQTTFETCLACCLLQSVGTLNKKNELACINHALRFSRDDFVSGHVDFIAKKFKSKVTRYVDNGSYANYLSRLKKVKGQMLKVAKIDCALIDNLLEQKPLLLIDDYLMFNQVHYPHWIIVLGKNGSAYRIFDVWDGVEKTYSEKELREMVSQLRNHLLMSPQMLVVDF